MRIPFTAEIPHPVSLLFCVQRFLKTSPIVNPWDSVLLYVMCDASICCRTACTWLSCCKIPAVFLASASAPCSVPLKPQRTGEIHGTGEPVEPLVNPLEIHPVGIEHFVQRLLFQIRLFQQNALV